MAHNPESSEFARAVSEIQNIKKEITTNQAQIANCQIQSAFEEGMLKTILAKAETPKNKEYLEVAKKACKATIKSWSLSIAAYQNDIDTYKTEINAILKRNPEARLDN